MDIIKGILIGLIVNGPMLISYMVTGGSFELTLLMVLGLPATLLMMDFYRDTLKTLSSLPEGQRNKRMKFRIEMFSIGILPLMATMYGVPLARAMWTVLGLVGGALGIILTFPTVAGALYFIYRILFGEELEKAIG